MSSLMKMFAATMILAVAALSAPAAVGQSQGLPVDAVRQVAYSGPELGQVATPSLRSVNPFVQLERSGGQAESTTAAPNPLAAWVMAIVFLGIVVMRRTRSRMF